MLERAYYETYGLTVRSILGPPIGAMSSYRVGVRRILPLFAKATIVNVRRHLPPDQPGPPLQQLLASISTTDYAANGSQYHHGPTFEDHVLGIIVRLIPKIGILKPGHRATVRADRGSFVKSLDVAVTQYQTLLTELSKSPSAELVLANRDLDTGYKVRPGAYRLTDRAYAELLHKVTAKPGLPIPAALREDMHGNTMRTRMRPSVPNGIAKAWKKVLAQLELLKNPATADRRQEGRQR